LARQRKAYPWAKEIAVAKRPKGKRGRESPPPQGAVVLSPDNPGKLTHAQIYKGEFAGKSAPGWTKLVRAGVRLAMERGHTVAGLRELMTAQIKEGTIRNKGFHGVPGTNPEVSLQNTNADGSWRNALAMAKKLKCEIRAEFYWREKPNAEHPGKNGVLRWSPA
jgi:hypothetical protein